MSTTKTEKTQRIRLFVLGGNDAEMEVIKSLLAQAGEEFVQPNKGWGQHQYEPADCGVAVLEPTEVPVRQQGHQYTEKIPERCDVREVIFIECLPKGSWPGAETMVIDHHNEDSRRPASILQVLSYLERNALYRGDFGQMRGSYHNDPSPRNIASAMAHLESRRLKLSEATRRWVELVAANDIGFIPAMAALGATKEEIERIRALDRSAQGITPQQEAEAEKAIGKKEQAGRLTVVRMSHSKTATVTDRLYGQYDQLLVLSEDGEANFFGDGALCAQLQEEFEGWSGGSGLGKEGGNAYWGGKPSQEEVERFIRENL